MRLFLLIFLFCIPSVNALAVSPSSVTFLDNSADIILINDHSFPVTYFVYGAANQQEFKLNPNERLLVHLSLNSSSDLVRIKEISSYSQGISITPEISLKTNIKKSILNKITGSIIAPFKELDLNTLQLSSLGLLGVVFLLSIFYIVFSDKKLFKERFGSFYPLWTSLKSLKNGRRNGKIRKSSK